MRKQTTLCTMCKKNCKQTIGQVVSCLKFEKNVVHHIEHLEDRPDLALEDDNLTTVCEACHNKLHPERWDVGRITKRKEITPERW